MYFDIFYKEEDIKKRYRLLSKFFHPDIGGNVELMQEVNKYYELALKKIKEEDQFSEFIKEDFSDDYSEEEYSEKIDKIIQFSKFYEKFDPSFILYLAETTLKGEKLSKDQRKSIDKIFTSFRVDERLKEFKKSKTA